MTLVLTDGQTQQVNAKRISPRPQYYNAGLQRKVTISEDFEAFLILQGRERNRATLDWLKKANDYVVRDADRDALIAYALDNEIEDAEASAEELAPIIDDFNAFKKSYKLQGFESVTEASTLLSDLQRPMSEIIALGNRHKHRITLAKLLKRSLQEQGITPAQQKQTNSWFSPLTSY